MKARDAGFGPWRILEALGEGAGGRVLLAQRADRADGRRVALKTLHSPSPGALARFELERQALARLEHPAIARLYDAGTSDAGVPYVVMEHVDGLPIDVHCARQALGIEARIKLFLEVCAGVRHAHRNLIVHRDLKPANILVDRDGRPRLLDFGIARLLDAPPGEAAGGSDTELAEATARTPAYASPEQIRGGPITTATDVFSLGTVLYELLAGRSPWPATASRHQLERAICEDDAPPASRAAKLAGVPAQEVRQLAGELDAILAKALARAPENRYPSVETLARDLENHLGHLPLLAKPPGAVAKARLFLRRHRAASLAAAALAAALGIFLLVLGRQAADLREERDKARRTLAFLIDIFRDEPPEGRPAAAGRPAPTARQILERGASRVERELAGQPAAQATLLGAIGRVYHGLGLYREAVALQQQAADKLAGGDELELATARYQLGRALVADNAPAAGEKELRSALEVRERRLPEGSHELIDHLTELADALEIQDPTSLAESIVFRREAAALAADAEPAKRLVALGSLGRALARDRQFAAAAQVNEQAYSLVLALPDAPSEKVASAVFEVGVAMYYNADPRYLQLYERALAIRRHVLPADHPRLLENEQGIALALLEEERWPEARERLAKVVEGKYRGLGKDHYLTYQVELELARCIGYLGDWKAATELAGEVLARAEASGKTPAELAIILVRLYSFEHSRGRLEIAWGHLRRAQKAMIEAGMHRTELIQLELYQAALEMELGQEQVARQRYELLIAELERDDGGEAWRVAYARGAYARLLARLGRGAEAVALAERSYDQLSAQFGAGSRSMRSTLHALQEAYQANGDEAASQLVETWLRDPARRPARL